MDQVTGQRLMAIFIGGIMVLSMVGFAMIQNRPEGPAPVQFPDVVDRTLTPEERVGILKGGTVIVEYFHNASCLECTEKETLYKNFVQSEESEGLLMLSYGTHENETMDWMINLDGTQIDLTGINSSAQLRKLFCDVAYIKPNICILQDI